MVRTCGVLSVLTWKCASHHSTVQFPTSQLPKVRLAHFTFEVCFAPQRRALSHPRMVCFVHSDFEMCFAPQCRALFSHISTVQLPKVLPYLVRATTACNSSSLIWPDGSVPAALASLLFDPPEPQTIGKTQCFATFLPFRAPASFFLLPLLFSDSSHLCFSSCLCCRKFGF